MDAKLAFTLVLGLPLVASPIIYLIGRLWARQNGASNNANPARWVALLVLIATGVFTYFAGVGATADYFGTAATLTFGSVNLVMDGIGLFLTITVLALGIMVTLFSTAYMQAEIGEEKFYALLTAMIGSIIGLGCATDLFNLWLWFEAMAITSYFLVAFYRNQAASLEAGIKYLVQSATGSTLVMLGIALAFAATGTLQLDLLRQAAQSADPLLKVAGALFVIGFGVKTALVPLHTWLPDAHSQAPSGISAMLSGIVIEAGMVAMLRSLGFLYATSTAWGILLLIFAVLNLVVGNLMALRQTQLKRLLAYSSISQVGYMLLGFGMTFTFGSTNGAVGGFFHLFNHALMKGLAFLAAGGLLYALYIANGHHGPLTLDDLNGASKRYPVTAFTLSLAVLALGGLPPLAGFMSKWQIFVSGFETGNTVAIILVIFAALNSVLSLGYYAPIVNRLYRGQPSEKALAGKPISPWMAAPMLLLALAIVALGVWPSLLTDLTSRAAISLFLLMGG